MSDQSKPVTRGVVMQKANFRLGKSGRALKFFPPGRFQIVDVDADQPIGPILNPRMMENWARQNGLVQPAEKVNLKKW